MALATYTNLKTAVTDWTHRADLASFADDFIDLTESKLNRKLRMSEMESSTSIAVTTADLALPAGFLEMREIKVSGSPDVVIEYLTPYQFASKVTTETGKPRYYTIQADAIKLFPYGSYTIEMVYYKEITPLDGTNTTNFILADFPELYLHGVLYQAFMFTKDFNAATVHGQLLDGLIEDINRISRRRKFMGNPLQVRVA